MVPSTSRGAVALTLRPQHPSLSVRGAIHSATMQPAAVVRFASADRGFDAVPRVQRASPPAAA